MWYDFIKGEKQFMKLRFSEKALEQLKAKNQWTNLCFNTIERLGLDDRGVNHFIMLANVKNISDYDHAIDTPIGKVHYQEEVSRILDKDNEIDYDDYHHAFLLLVNGQVVEDDIPVMNELKKIDK